MTVVGNDPRVVVALVVGVVVVKDGCGAGADGRTRHGRADWMECNKKITTEVKFILQPLSYCRPFGPYFCSMHYCSSIMCTSTKRGFV